MKVTAKYALIPVIITYMTCTLLCGNAFSENKRAAVNTVVLDAGHGGKDPGCTYGKYLEKNITLSVALKLGKLIQENYPEVKVVYTRSTDVYVDLYKRGDIANKAGADLFLSIHVDAVAGKSAHGNSSFVMGMDKTEKNLAEAMRENDVVQYEEDYSTKYEGYVPGSPESYIMFSLMQYAYQDNSMLFAEMIQRHYRANTGLADRGARQAPYLVLWKTAMPSVLTEIGFISNDSDRQFLVSEAGQQRIVRSLFNAFSEYKSKVEGRNQVITLSDTAPAAPAQSAAQEQTSAPQSQNTAETDTPVQKSAAGKKSKVEYRIQVCSSTERIPINSKRFGVYKGKVTEKRVGGRYKYYVGSFNDLDKAKAKLREVKKHVPDAFVAAFVDGKSATLAQAAAAAGK